MITLESIPRALAGRASVFRQHLRRARLLGVAIALVLLAGYLGTALLVAAVVGTAEAAPFSMITVLMAALPGWLAVHQAPLSITGSPLSAFPLVPTGLAMLLIATASSQVARRGRLRRPDQARWIVLPMGLAHGMFGIAVALVLGGVVEADPVSAFLHCGLTALVASTAGVANRCGLTYLVWEHVRPEFWSGIRIALSALAAAVAVGAFLVLAGLLVSLPEFVAMLERTGSAGDAFGLTLLSLLYLPNAVLAGWSFAVGSGFSIGAVELTPLHMTSGSVPEVPLLAVLPSSGPSWWWMIVFGVPLLWGLWIGVSCRRAATSTNHAFWMLATAALIVSLVVGLATGMAGGRLGGGAFDPVALYPGLLAVTTFCWISIPAASVVWLGRSDEEPAHSQAGVPSQSGIEDQGGIEDQPEVEAQSGVEVDDDVESAEAALAEPDPTASEAGLAEGEGDGSDCADADCADADCADTDTLTPEAEPPETGDSEEAVRSEGTAAYPADQPSDVQDGDAEAGADVHAREDASAVAPAGPADDSALDEDSAPGREGNSGRPASDPAGQGADARPVDDDGRDGSTT